VIAKLAAYMPAKTAANGKSRSVCCVAAALAVRHIHELRVIFLDSFVLL
jgi:hypothetical protein